MFGKLKWRDIMLCIILYVALYLLILVIYIYILDQEIATIYYSR